MSQFNGTSSGGDNVEQVIHRSSTDEKSNETNEMISSLWRKLITRKRFSQEKPGRWKRNADGNYLSQFTKIFKNQITSTRNIAFI